VTDRATPDRATPDRGRAEWGDFPSTHLRFVDAPEITIDVRGHVGVEERAALAAHGLTGSFAVVTAQDPMGKTQPPEVNQALATKLQDHVRSLGVPYARVEACSPDRSHCEDSIALVLARDECVTLARDYDQLAIFWFDGDAFWIVPARSSKPAVRLARAR
jgi:hypothetical protein